MLKQLLEFGKSLVELVQKSRKHDEDIKQLHNDVARLNRRVDHLIVAVRELAFELKRDRENSAKDQQILRLQLDELSSASSAAFLQAAAPAIRRGSRKNDREKSLWRYAWPRSLTESRCGRH